MKNEKKTTKDKIQNPRRSPEHSEGDKPQMPIRNHQSSIPLRFAPGTTVTNQPATSNQIESELKRAEAAQAAGNAGLARVCARRAAGMAIREWSGQVGDAMKQLGKLQLDDRVPENVREAARRLSTKVQLDHTLPFESDPLEDARLIIEYLKKDPS